LAAFPEEQAEIVKHQQPTILVEPVLRPLEALVAFLEELVLRPLEALVAFPEGLVLRP
jgi:hypothetical protein